MPTTNTALTLQASCYDLRKDIPTNNVDSVCIELVYTTINT